MAPESVEWIWIAYRALETCRSIGMAWGPIPWTAIDRYAERYGIHGDTFERLNFWIRMMDAASLEDERR